MLFEEEGAVLLHEHHLLGQLIHRNNNQHQRTGLFALIKMLNRRIKTFTSPDALKSMKTKVTLCASAISAMTAKGRTVTVRQFEQILESAICFYDALILIAEMLNICERVHHCIAEQLCKKLFAPLYSTIFAVNARIYTCLGRLMLECDMQFENTRQFVKHAVIRHTTLAELGNRFLKMANHPAQVVQVLSSFKATAAAMDTKASSKHFAHHAVLSSEASDPVDAVTMAPVAMGQDEDEDNDRANEDDDDLNGQGTAELKESTPTTMAGTAATFSHGTAKDDEPPHSYASEVPTPAPVSRSEASNQRVHQEGVHPSLIDGNTTVTAAPRKSPTLDKDQHWHPDLPQQQQRKKAKMKKRKRAVIEEGEGEQRQEDGDDIDDIFSLLSK